MRRFLLPALFCLAANSGFGQSQAQMNQDAAKNYQKADKELNAVYQKIVSQYRQDTAFIRNLKKAQKIWVQFRHAEMLAKYPEREAGYYGSIHPVCWYSCLADLTSERTRTLKVWLTGIEEGDACAGSVRIK